MRPSEIKWLARFAPREQILILIAAALVVLFILWQFLVSPVFAASSDADRRLNAAKRDHMIVSAGARKMSAQTRQGARAAFERSGVISTASLANISISRMQPAADGSLQVWLEDGPALNIYSFLSELDTRYSVRTVKAQMTRREDGTVAAQFTFAPL